VKMEFVAHRKQGCGGIAEHLLEEHLKAVAALATGFAPSGFGEWSYLAGLWHDLGKYRPGFQRYIRQDADASAHDTVASHDKTHSAAGARLAIDRFGVAGHALAYLIAGHHAGLSDWRDLDYRLQSDAARCELNESLESIPGDIQQASLVSDLCRVPGGSKGFALWLRLLFSCLVDADFLDTERFMEAGKADSRSRPPAMAGED